MKMRLAIWAACTMAALSLASAALAISPDELLSDPGLQARARAIDKELRCVVCQDESIDESNAEIAHDLRMLVRERLLRGDSDEEIKQYIVKRYGNFVLLRPPLIGETVVLWLGPILLFLCGAGLLWSSYRRRAAADASGAPLSPEERRSIEDLWQDIPEADGR